MSASCWTRSIRGLRDRLDTTGHGGRGRCGLATALETRNARWVSGIRGGTGATGLEPATSGVTGRRSNQLSYAPERIGMPSVVANRQRRPGPLESAVPCRSRRRRRSSATRSRACTTTCASSGRPRSPSRRASRTSTCAARAASRSTPLPILLDCYERFGPVFTIRVFHSNVIFMLGPEANHFMTVSHAANFSWRRGFMGDLIPLLGDGLLTIDGDFHRQSRKIMLPAFHRERIEAAHAIMTAETQQALDRVSADTPFDLYRFTRELALRIAMRALFGLDPDRARAGGVNAAHEFEEALGFWARDYLHQILRGPGSPWRRMVRARRRLDALIFAEIDRRRASGGGRRGHPEPAARRHRRGRRDALQAPHPRRGHDADVRRPRHDDLDGRLPLPRAGPQPGAARRPVVRPRPGHRRDAAPVPAGVDRAAPLDRAVRPSAACRCRAACRSTTARGPATACPTCGPSPTPSAPSASPRATASGSPKGAYVPFGGGSRMCIGMRFGLAEVGVIAAAILERFRLELAPGYRLRDPPDADHRPQARDADGAACGHRAGPSSPSPPWPRRASATCRPSRSARRSRRPWSGSRPPTGPRSGWCPSARASSSCTSRWPPS